MPKERKAEGRIQIIQISCLFLGPFKIVVIRDMIGLVRTSRQHIARFGDFGPSNFNLSSRILLVWPVIKSTNNTLSKLRQLA